MKNRSKKKTTINPQDERDFLLSKDKYFLKAEEKLKAQKIEKRENSFLYKLFKKIKFH